ncbi:MAG TPA: HepT-like ribonuclease domain-containing protein [Thermoanaerobaculia bacterium]
MRNRLIHGYFDINRDILWATVQDSLPSLTQALESALAGDREA